MDIGDQIIDAITEELGAVGDRSVPSLQTEGDAGSHSQ